MNFNLHSLQKGIVCHLRHIIVVIFRVTEIISDLRGVRNFNPL
jgi:hypothetical protein